MSGTPLQAPSACADRSLRHFPLLETPMAESRFTLEELDRAATLVYRVMAPTPQYAWPKLRSRAGCTVWVKHENHTPTGAIKVRGGVVYMDRLIRAQPKIA